MCVKFREDCSNKRFFFPILCENVKIAKYQTLPENICKSCSHPIIISKLVCCLIFNDFAATFASFILQNLLFLENWQYKKMFSCDLMRFLLTSPHTFFFQMINLPEAAQNQLRKIISPCIVIIPSILLVSEAETRQDVHYNPISEPNLDGGVYLCSAAAVFDSRIASRPWRSHGV